MDHPNPMPVLKCGGHVIEWVKSYKYLGYQITTKIDWGQVISCTQIKIRRQITMVNSVRFGGSTSSTLRHVLFSIFVLTFFTCLYALLPLFTDVQRTNLDHFYYTQLKRIYHCFFWNDLLFALAFDEHSLDDLCFFIMYRMSKKFAVKLNFYYSCICQNSSTNFMSNCVMIIKIKTSLTPYQTCLFCCMRYLKRN